MNTFIFVAGLAIGALAAFAFMFICMAIITSKSDKKLTKNTELLQKLWQDYIKENQNVEEQTPDKDLHL